MSFLGERHHRNKYLQLQLHEYNQCHTVDLVFLKYAIIDVSIFWPSRRNVALKLSVVIGNSIFTYDGNYNLNFLTAYIAQRTQYYLVPHLNPVMAAIWFQSKCLESQSKWTGLLSPNWICTILVVVVILRVVRRWNITKRWGKHGKHGIATVCRHYS